MEGEHAARAALERAKIPGVGQRVFDCGLPARQVVSTQESAVTAAAGVEHFSLPTETVDGFRDETPVPAVAGCLDLMFPGSAGLLGIAD